MLEDLLMGESTEDPAVVIYLLLNALTKINSTQGDDSLFAEVRYTVTAFQ
jgi:hypothetical protein